MRLTAAERRLEMAAGKIPRILRFGDVDWRDVARLLDHHWLGEESIEGRRAAVIESIPNPAVPGETPAATRALSYRYKFWIDLTDHVLLKTEVEVVRPGVDSAPGSRITSWRARVGNVWLMKAWSGNFHTEESRWWRQEHVFTNFREFAAESKIDFTSPERKPLPPVH